MRLIFLAALALAFHSRAFAQSKPENQDNPQIIAEERERVKKRLYPGGRDEDTLQVQAQLAAPSRGAAAPEPDEPADHD